LRTRNIVLIFIGALIVGGGLGFVITGFATSGAIAESFTFNHQAASPSSVEQVVVSADIGKIVIKYNSTPTPYFIHVDADIKVSGLFMAGKKYTNFFSPSTGWWQNSSGQVTFSLEARPDIWFDPSHWFKNYNITITVTLRTDIIYYLDAIATTGSINAQIPDNVKLDSFFLSTTTGSINADINAANLTKGFTFITTTGTLTTDLMNTTIGDDMTAVVDTGSINFLANNLEYTKDIAWDLSTNTGSIDITLNQNKPMGANITGYIETDTGGIDFIYSDNQAVVGAIFTSDITTGSFNYVNSGGFETLPSPNDDIFRSLDYLSATNKYMFDLVTTTGGIDVDGQSS
jgi:hypothetical protein